ncbi:MAG: hypothetical protein HQL82_08230 [Magnetococcales bacterium]|nr:hypothetical protein [Magnetococcales bacterium]
MGNWGCPHEVEGRCVSVQDRPCDPGMKGCVLFGRVTFADADKNRPTRSVPVAGPADPLAGAPLKER